MGSQKQFGERVKKNREKKGYTQQELADKTGFHVSYISRIERGVENPTYEIIEKLAKALKVKATDLMPF